MVHEFRKARRICQSSDSRDGQALSRVCMQIQEAERALNRAATPYLKRCIQVCQGLCCRNVYLYEIIGLEDFIFLLNRMPDLDAAIEDRLSHLERMFTADCVFLENGKGPCLFPADIRPEMCITSFCINTPDASRHIRAVKRGFLKLAWTVRLDRTRRLFKSVDFRIHSP